MAKTANTATAANTDSLNMLIELCAASQFELAKIQARIDQYKEAIKAGLHTAELQRYMTPGGCEALLIESKVYTFSVEKLQKAIRNDVWFDELCPRCPDTSALRKLIDSGIHKDLKACAKITTRESLSIRPKAEDVKPQ